MSEKKNQEAPRVDALCTPPSHPTSLGNVWVGESRPSEAALAEVMKMATRSEKAWDK